MSNPNLFNICKGDLNRYKQLWSRGPGVNPTPIDTTTLEFDHTGYSLLVIVYATYIRMMSRVNSDGSTTTYYVDGVLDTCIIVNDPSIPYTKNIVSTELSTSSGYRPITIQNNGLFIGAHSKNANNYLIPYRIYGIR